MSKSSKTTKKPSKKKTGSTSKTSASKSKTKKDTTKAAKTKTKATKKETKTSPKKKTPAKSKPVKKKETKKKAKPFKAKKDAKPPPKKSASMKTKTKTSKKKAVKKVVKTEFGTDILDELAKEVQSEDQQVCLGAVERLGMIENPMATAILLRVLKDPRFMVRIHAAAQLGDGRDKKSVDALIETLHDTSLFVRQTAASALENIGGTKAKKAVAMAEKDGRLLDELPEGKRLMPKQ